MQAPGYDFIIKKLTIDCNKNTDHKKFFSLFLCCSSKKVRTIDAWIRLEHFTLTIVRIPCEKIAVILLSAYYKIHHTNVHL